MHITDEVQNALEHAHDALDGVRRTLRELAPEQQAQFLAPLQEVVKTIDTAVGAKARQATQKQREAALKDRIAKAKAELEAAEQEAAAL